MPREDWIAGHTKEPGRLNVRKTLKRYRRDPMVPLFVVLGERPYGYQIMESEGSRYAEAYEFYYLSLDRFLPELSLAMRYDKQVRLKAEWQVPYTDHQRRLADRYNAIKRYLLYDLVNCLIHARILMDRIAALSRHFLKGGQLPSFTSFNAHKKFFTAGRFIAGHEEYGRVIAEETDWFDVPLKLVRDKYLIHASPQHHRVFGFSSSDLNLVIMKPTGDDPKKPLRQVQCIITSIPVLAEQVHAFQVWFCNYAVNALTDGAVPEAYALWESDPEECLRRLGPFRPPEPDMSL